MLPSKICSGAIAFLVGASLSFPQSTSSQPGEGRAPALTKTELDLLRQCNLVEHRLERRALIDHDTGLEEHLATVARPLFPGTPTNQVQWRFLILREPLVTAISLPNGTIYVSTGLLARLENDDQVAGILAHEMAHTANGDAFLALREYRKKETTRNIAALAARTAPLAGAGLGPGALALDGAGLTAYLILSNTFASTPLGQFATNGYGEREESRADQDAYASLQRARLSAEQMVRGIELTAEERDPEPLLTFYTDPEKLRSRKALFQRIGVIRTESQVSSGAYLKSAQGAIREDIQMDIESGRFRSAVTSAQRLVSAHPDDATSVYLLGEAYRSLGPRGAQLSPEERSPKGQRAGVKDVKKYTAAEEDKLLEATPQGQETTRTNWQRAEGLFVQAAQMDTRFAKPHLGLGMLYQQQGRLGNAREEYLKYLELAPDASDRLRVQNRLAALEAERARP